MRDVSINLKGTHRDGKDCDVLEYFTTGKFACKDGKYLIEYDESVPMGVAGAKGVVRVESDRRVILQHSGAMKSRLIVEKGKRNLCHYDMEFGAAMFGVFGEVIENSLSASGGRLRLSYTLDFNSNLICENELEISVKEDEPCDLL